MILAFSTSLFSIYYLFSLFFHLLNLRLFSSYAQVECFHPCGVHEPKWRAKKPSCGKFKLFFPQLCFEYLQNSSKFLSQSLTVFPSNVNAFFFHFPFFFRDKSLFLSLINFSLMSWQALKRRTHNSLLISCTVCSYTIQL